MQDDNIKQDQPVGDEGKKKTTTPWAICILFGVIFTLGAWLAIVFNEHVSFWCAVCGFAFSLIGAIKSVKGMWRDTGITATVASGVLLLVYGIFYFALVYAINSL